MSSRSLILASLSASSSSAVSCWSAARGEERPPMDWHLEEIELDDGEVVVDLERLEAARPDDGMKESEEKDLMMTSVPDSGFLILSS